MFLLAKYGVQTTFRFPMVKRGVVDLAATADWTPATGDTKISKDGGNVANTTNNPAAVGGTGSVLWTLTLTAAELTAGEVQVQIVDSATKAVEDTVLNIYTYGNASAKIVEDFGTAIPNQVWDALRSNHVIAGSMGLLPRGIISDGTAQAGAAGSITLGTGEPTTVDIFKGAVVVIYSGTGAGQARMITAYSSGRVAAVVPNWVVTPDNTSKYITHAYADPVFVGQDNKVILSSDAHTGAVVPTVTTLTGHTPQTGDTFARVGAPVGASISADIAANKTVVDAVKAKTDLLPEGIKKNTAFNNFHFMMFDSTTGAGKTGIADGSFTKKVIIDNGSQASIAGTITEVDATNFPGLYRVSLAAGELNGDNVTLRFAASGAKETVLYLKPSP
jgi:hypothetical protein